jgi:hypothetical protein
MIHLREYEPEDWTEIDDAVEPFMFHRPLKEFNEIIEQGVAITAVEDGVVTVCGGIALVNDDEGIVWIKVSRKCLNQPIRYARGIRDVFKIMADCIGPIRITTYIVDEFCKGEKLARFVGLKRNGETCEFKNRKYNKYVMAT